MRVDMKVVPEWMKMNESRYEGCSRMDEDE